MSQELSLKQLNIGMKNKKVRENALIETTVARSAFSAFLASRTDPQCWLLRVPSQSQTISPVLGDQSRLGINCYPKAQHVCCLFKRHKSDVLYHFWAKCEFYCKKQCYLIPFPSFSLFSAQKDYFNFLCKVLTKSPKKEELKNVRWREKMCVKFILLFASRVKNPD